MLLQHFEILWFEPIKVFVVSDSSSVSEQEWRTAHAQRNSRYWKSAESRVRERGKERIKEKPRFESILLFYGWYSLSLTYQQETKNWNQVKGPEIRRELSVAFQQSHRSLVLALATLPPPLPLRSPSLHDTTWEHVIKDWESGQWLLMLKGHDMCTRQGIGAGCTY